MVPDHALRAGFRGGIIRVSAPPVFMIDGGGLYWYNKFKHHINKGAIECQGNF